MDVFVGIVVEIVIFEQNVATGKDANVPITKAADVDPSAVVTSHRELFGDVQLHVVVAAYETIQQDGAQVIGDFKEERIQVTGYEVVLAQSAFVNVPVIVPGVPAVGVVSRKNFSPS